MKRCGRNEEGTASPPSPLAHLFGNYRDRENAANDDEPAPVASLLRILSPVFEYRAHESIATKKSPARLRATTRLIIDLGGARRNSRAAD